MKLQIICVYLCKVENSLCEESRFSITSVVRPPGFKYKSIKNMIRIFEARVLAKFMCNKDDDDSYE